MNAILQGRLQVERHGGHRASWLHAREDQICSYMATIQILLRKSTFMAFNIVFFFDFPAFLYIFFNLQFQCSCVSTLYFNIYLFVPLLILKNCKNIYSQHSRRHTFASTNILVLQHPHFPKFTFSQHLRPRANTASHLNSFIPPKRICIFYVVCPLQAFKRLYAPLLDTHFLALWSTMSPLCCILVIQLAGVSISPHKNHYASAIIRSRCTAANGPVLKCSSNMRRILHSDTCYCICHLKSTWYYIQFQLGEGGWDITSYQGNYW